MKRSILGVMLLLVTNQAVSFGQPPGGGPGDPFVDPPAPEVATVTSRAVDSVTFEITLVAPMVWDLNATATYTASVSSGEPPTITWSFPYTLNVYTENAVLYASNSGTVVIDPDYSSTWTSSTAGAQTITAETYVAYGKVKGVRNGNPGEEPQELGWVMKAATASSGE